MDVFFKMESISTECALKPAKKTVRVNNKKDGVVFCVVRLGVKNLKNILIFP